MSTRRQITLTGAALALVTASAAAAQELAVPPSLECEFRPGFSALYPTENFEWAYEPDFAYSVITVTFTKIDTASYSAEMLDRQGSKVIRAEVVHDFVGEGDCEDCGAPILVLTEPPPGTTSLTSVLLRTNEDGHFAAVHTRQTQMFGELSTVTYLGFCVSQEG